MRFREETKEISKGMKKIDFGTEGKKEEKKVKRDGHDTNAVGKHTHIYMRCTG